jgi:hypothetical protein
MSSHEFQAALPRRDAFSSRAISAGLDLSCGVIRSLRLRSGLLRLCEMPSCPTLSLQNRVSHAVESDGLACVSRFSTGESNIHVFCSFSMSAVSRFTYSVTSWVRAYCRYRIGVMHPPVLPLPLPASHRLFCLALPHALKRSTPVCSH